MQGSKTETSVSGSGRRQLVELVVADDQLRSHRFARPVAAVVDERDDLLAGQWETTPAWDAQAGRDLGVSVELDDEQRSRLGLRSPPPKRKRGLTFTL